MSILRKKMWIAFQVSSRRKLIVIAPPIFARFIPRYRSLSACPVEVLPK